MIRFGLALGNTGLASIYSIFLGNTDLASIFLGNTSLTSILFGDADLASILKIYSFLVCRLYYWKL